MARKPSSGHTPDAPVLPAGGSIDLNALSDALAAGKPADEAVKLAEVAPSGPAAAPTPAEPVRAPEPVPDDLVLDPQADA